MQTAVGFSSIAPREHGGSPLPACLPPAPLSCSLCFCARCFSAVSVVFFQLSRALLTWAFSWSTAILISSLLATLIIPSSPQQIKPLSNSILSLLPNCLFSGFTVVYPDLFAHPFLVLRQPYSLSSPLCCCGVTGSRGSLGSVSRRQDKAGCGEAHWPVITYNPAGKQSRAHQGVGEAKGNNPALIRLVLAVLSDAPPAGSYMFLMPSFIIIVRCTPTSII